MTRALNKAVSRDGDGVSSSVVERYHRSLAIAQLTALPTDDEGIQRGGLVCEELNANSAIKHVHSRWCRWLPS